MQLSLQEKRRSPAADGERAVKGEKKTVTEPRVEKLRPSAYWRRVGPSRKTLIIVKFYEQLHQRADSRGNGACRFSPSFLPSPPPPISRFPYISLFFLPVFPARESQSGRSFAVAAAGAVALAP